MSSHIYSLLNTGSGLHCWKSYIGEFVWLYSPMILCTQPQQADSCYPTIINTQDGCNQRPRRFYKTPKERRSTAMVSCTDCFALALLNIKTNRLAICP